MAYAKRRKSRAGSTWRKRTRYLAGSSRFASFAQNRTRTGRGRTSRDTVHQFQQMASTSITSGGTTVLLTTIIPTSSTGVGFCFTPAFQDINQASGFGVLYDQYKLWKVQFRFRLVNNPDAATANAVATPANSANWFPTLWLVPDHDDSTVPTLPIIKEYARVKPFILRPNGYTKYTIHPNVLTQLYAGTITTGYKLEKPGSVWCDMNQAGIPHYGLKGFFDTTGITVAQAFILQIEAKYFFACKCVR